MTQVILDSWGFALPIQFINNPPIIQKQYWARCYKNLSCSPQLSMKFILLINVKMAF